MKNILSDIGKRAEDAKEISEQLRKSVTSYQNWRNSAERQVNETQEKLDLLVKDVDAAYQSIDKLATKASLQIDSAVLEIQDKYQNTLNDHISKMKIKVNRLVIGLSFLAGVSLTSIGFAAFIYLYNKGSMPWQ